MLALWKNYQNKFEYAAKVEWSDVMDAIIGLYRNMADVSASVQ